MLDTAGFSVEEVFFTLDEGTGDNNYLKAKDALNKYFKPQDLPWLSVSQPLKPEPMTRTELSSAPWKHLAADLLGPLPSGHYIFVVVDYCSRFFEIEFTKSITDEKIVSLMSKMFVQWTAVCQ